MVPQSYEQTGSIWHPKAHSSETGIRDQLGDSGTFIATIQAVEGAQDYPLP